MFIKKLLVYDINFKQFVALFLAFVINLRSFSAEQVNANIEIVDQIKEAQSKVIYYWESGSGSNEPRSLNVKVSLSLNNGNSVKLDPPAKIKIVCTLQPLTSTSFADVTFTDTSFDLIENSIFIIPFTINRGGASRLFSCNGQVNSFVTQTNPQLTSLNFVPSSTQTQLIISNYPTISFSKNQALNTSLVIPSSLNASLNIIFSEKVRFQNVTLTCSVSSTNQKFLLNNNGQLANTLTQNVLIGSTTAQIFYFIVGSGDSNVALTCNTTAVSDVNLQAFKNAALASITLKEISVPTKNQLLDPSYDPCTCDLSIKECDSNCCCDPDCNQDDFAALKLVCLKKSRPVFDKTADRWTCKNIYNSPKFEEPDWFPILCIQFNTTVLLGNFYSPDTLNAYTSSQNFGTDVNNRVKSSYNYRSNFLNDPLYASTSITASEYCSLNVMSAYLYGSCLKKATLETDTTASDFFRLPRSINSLKSCVIDAPVKFLESDYRSFCPIFIDEDACEPNSNFDVSTFIKPNIFKNPIDKEKVEFKNEYYKCDEPFSGGTPSTVANTPLNCGIQCQFDENTKLFDGKLNENICSVDTWAYSINRNNAQVTSDYYLKPDEFNKNCQKLENIPTTLLTNKCSNSVASVKYVFFWNGKSISKVLTRIVVTDANLRSSIKQMFEVRWNYLPPVVNDTFGFNDINTMTDYDNKLKSDPYINSLKSGIKGYQIGKPLISGYKPPGDNTQIDIKEGQRISTYKILNGKLCGILSKIERTQLIFGQNTSSSCIVQVAKSDLASQSTCTCLRRIIFNKLNDYFVPSNYVSKNGNPTMNTTFVSSDWLNVYPNNRTLPEQPIKNPNISNVYTCLGVPSKVDVWFFYADVGKSSGVPFYEIIGSYVSYSYSNWSFVCTGENKLKCENDPSALKDFEITFQSNFIKISSKNLTWNEHCSADKYPSEFCLNQVFWTWPNDKTDPNFFYLYAVQLGLLFGIFSILVFYLMIFGLICPC